MSTAEKRISDYCVIYETLILQRGLIIDIPTNEREFLVHFFI